MPKDTSCTNDKIKMPHSCEQQAHDMKQGSVDDMSALTPSMPTSMNFIPETNNSALYRWLFRWIDWGRFDVPSEKNVYMLLLELLNHYLSQNLIGLPQAIVEDLKQRYEQQGEFTVEDDMAKSSEQRYWSRVSSPTQKDGGSIRFKFTEHLRESFLHYMTTDGGGSSQQYDEGNASGDGVDLVQYFNILMNYKPEIHVRSDVVEENNMRQQWIMAIKAVYNFDDKSHFESPVPCMSDGPMKSALVQSHHVLFNPNKPILDRIERDQAERKRFAEEERMQMRQDEATKKERQERDEAKYLSGLGEGQRLFYREHCRSMPPFLYAQMCKSKEGDECALSLS